MTAIAHVAPIAGLELAPTRSRFAAWVARIGAILRQIGPYAAIEILLPGGTLMALLLWLYRRSVSVRVPQNRQRTLTCAWNAGWRMVTSTSGVTSGSARR